MSQEQFNAQADLVVAFIAGATFVFIIEALVMSL